MQSSCRNEGSRDCRPWRERVKVVILAGGFGTRISEETAVRPKPMVEVGGRPLLWHIMKIYGSQGLSDFVISGGYKCDVIKDYFARFFVHASDVTFDLGLNTVESHRSDVEPWRVTVCDTGAETMTGGRIKRVLDFLDESTFCMTYGDCVADIDIGNLVAFHRSHGGLATVTAVRPTGRFGALTFGEKDAITSFHEKPEGDGGWINGGFFVLEPDILDYIAGDATVWEREPMERLARDGKLHAYRHTSYWQNLDTLRDRMILEQAWTSGAPPWKVW
jgi:glucose-1-phosphate cytidylyltransferase